MGGYKNLHCAMIKSQDNGDAHIVYRYTSFVTDVHLITVTRRLHIVGSLNDWLFCSTTLFLKVNHTRVTVTNLTPHITIIRARRNAQRGRNLYNA